MHQIKRDSHNHHDRSVLVVVRVFVKRTSVSEWEENVEFAAYTGCGLNAFENAQREVARLRFQRKNSLESFLGELPRAMACYIDALTGTCAEIQTSIDLMV